MRKAPSPPFTGKYWDHKQPGVYKCVCCGLPLFDSTAKFDSGTGWPSFSKPIAEQNIETRPDSSLLISRSEVVCHKCKAHLGHVFEDGPKPTNLRYCLNSASLDFAQRADAARNDDSLKGSKEGTRTSRVTDMDEEAAPACSAVSQGV